MIDIIANNKNTDITNLLKKTESNVDKESNISSETYVGPGINNFGKSDNFFPFIV